MGGACSKHDADENSYNILFGKLLGKRNLGDLGNAGRIIIRWILEK
jgi:hypothetical protein